MAIQIGIGLSTEKDPLAAAQFATRQAGARLKAEKVDLAIVFSSVEFAHPMVLQTISNAIRQAPIVGCSSLRRRLSRYIRLS